MDIVINSRNPSNIIVGKVYILYRTLFNKVR